MNFSATARNLLKKLSNLTFDQSGEPADRTQIVSKVLNTAYEKGYNAALTFKTTAKPPRNPEGGWLPPERKAYVAFWDECQKEADRRFGLDEDRDSVVRVDLTDRSREEKLNFEQIPHEINDIREHPYADHNWNVIGAKHTLEEEETRNKILLENKFWIRRMVLLNWSLANQRLEQLLREEEYNLRDEIERPGKERAARIKTLESRTEWWADPIKSLRNTGYTVDIKRGVYFDPDKPEEYVFKSGRKNVRPIPTKPENFEEEMKELERLKAFKPAPELKY